MTTVCKYFVSQTGCKYGDKCTFSHSKIAIKNTRNHSSSICRLFLSKKCRYGNKCKFIHPKRNNQTNRNYQQKKDLKSQKHLSKTKICKLYLQNKCIYGSNCRYFHSKTIPNKNKYKYNTRNASTTKRSSYDNHNRYQSSIIELNNFNINLKYFGFIQPKNIINDTNLYFYYNNATLSNSALTFVIIKDNDVTYKYTTDIILDPHSTKYCDYICGVIQQQYLFIQKNGMIYKCERINLEIFEDQYTHKYKTIDRIMLNDYDDLKLIASISNDDQQNICITHDLCICKRNSHLLMSFSLYGSKAQFKSIHDIHIFNIDSNCKMECIYNINRGVNVMNGMRITFGEFYWYNENILFYTEYGSSKSGLANFCIGYDLEYFSNKGRNILSKHLEGVRSLVDVVFEYLGSFNYLYSRRNIFKEIKLIQIDKRNETFYVSYFDKNQYKRSRNRKTIKDYHRNKMHAYQILNNIQ